MELQEFDIKGLLAFTPRVFEDERGHFFESFNQKAFDEMVGDKVNFVQDNQSLSHKNVLRGLHFQKPSFAQGKLVRVIQGAVLDVAVDLRKSSPTYGQYQKIVLSGDNNCVFWIPEGFAHGFVTLESNTIFSYKCTNLYDKASEDGLNWNDPGLAVDWELTEEPILSEKDRVETEFTNYKSPF